MKSLNEIPNGIQAPGLKIDGAALVFPIAVAGRLRSLGTAGFLGQGLRSGLCGRPWGGFGPRTPETCEHPGPESVDGRESSLGWVGHGKRL